MKLKNILLFVFTVIISSSASADDGLYVKEVSIPRGGEAVLEIMLNNEDREYTAFVFDLLLPKGVSISKGDAFEVVYESSRVEDSQYELIVDNPGDGLYRFIGYHTSNASFIGYDGTLIRVKLHADDNVTDSEQTAYIMTDPRSIHGGTSALGFIGTNDFHTYHFNDVNIPIKVTNSSGIISVKQSTESNMLYNLQGQRVEKVTKGIYIENGKKVIKK